MIRKSLCLALAMLLLTACMPMASLGETAAFTDGAGRTVNLPSQIDRIAPSGPLAQMILFALAPEKLVGLTSRWDSAAEEYMGAYAGLPVLGQLYGTSGDLNLETLATADPQVIIDLGEAKKTIVEDLDAITAQTGIPSVHINASLLTMPEAFRALGALLGLSERAETLAAFCETTYARAEAVMEKVGTENKARALYLLGDNGQNVIAKGSFHAELLDMLCDNLAVVDNPSGKGTGNETSMEQILLWNPDVILFAPGSVYDEAAVSDIWKTYTAIQTDKFVEVPYGPYNWMGFPASVQRYLGMLWLPAVLYPESCEYDLYTEVAAYYDLFYHHTLTQEQFDRLMEKATFGVAE